MLQRITKIAYTMLPCTKIVVNNTCDKIVVNGRVRVDSVLAMDLHDIHPLVHVPCLGVYRTNLRLRMRLYVYQQSPRVS